jgi:replication-associated recombination protein RarA
VDKAFAIRLLELRVQARSSASDRPAETASVGQTALARLITDGIDSNFVAQSAVMVGSANQQGVRSMGTRLFADEIERLSNPQQELQPSVHAGPVTI